MRDHLVRAAVGDAFAATLRFAPETTFSINEAPNSVSVGSIDPFEAIGRIRFEVSRRHLRGHGLEIGAGPRPQRLPRGAKALHFELRDPDELARAFGWRAASLPESFEMEEIPKRFPDGADFLIAHNVLEHCPDPVGTLISWTRYVKDDGAVVISVPARDSCPDKGRLVPSAEHILLDYLLERDAESFESREHAYSCIMGWMNEWEDWIPMDKVPLAERAHATAHMKDLDVHWHAFTPDSFDCVFRIASWFSERPLRTLTVAHPHLEEPNKTLGDIIYVFSPDPTHDPSVPAEIGAMEDRLLGALAKLRKDRVGS